LHPRKGTEEFVALDQKVHGGLRNIIRSLIPNWEILMMMMRGYGYMDFRKKIG